MILRKQRPTLIAKNGDQIPHPISMIHLSTPSPHQTVSLKALLRSITPGSKARACRLFPHSLHSHSLSTTLLGDASPAFFRSLFHSFIQESLARNDSNATQKRPSPRPPSNAPASPSGHALPWVARTVCLSGSAAGGQEGRSHCLDWPGHARSPRRALCQPPVKIQKRTCDHLSLGRGRSGPPDRVRGDSTLRTKDSA
jgi:hypothetical protein